MLLASGGLIGDIDASRFIDVVLFSDFAGMKLAMFPLNTTTSVPQTVFRVVAVATALGTAAITPVLLRSPHTWVPAWLVLMVAVALASAASLPVLVRNTSHSLSLILLRLALCSGAATGLLLRPEARSLLSSVNRNGNLEMVWILPALYVLLAYAAMRLTEVGLHARQALYSELLRSSEPVETTLMMALGRSQGSRQQLWREAVKPLPYLWLQALSLSSGGLLILGLVASPYWPWLFAAVLLDLASLAGHWHVYQELHGDDGDALRPSSVYDASTGKEEGHA